MGSSDGNSPAYLAAARKLGCLLAANDIGLVYGGATGGLMGAVADGVLDNNGYAVGVWPNVLMGVEQHPGLSELITTSTMQERKQLMADKADVFVALPGGSGTLDELTEVIDFRKLKHHDKPIFALNTQNFWNPLREMYQKMEEAGFMKSGLRVQLCEFVGSPEELLERVQSCIKP
mmetsp:Transcript_9170/g.16729  ORF Transcript_9170/g.16729 Transcript_9170/m.16729 type:complete len:176 (-) Transcript_9170:122-649(-)